MKNKKMYIAIIIILSILSCNIHAAAMMRDLEQNGKSHWAAITIQKLTAAGIISGYADGTYRPEKEMTRAEFVKLLVETLKLEKTERKSFDDIDKHWAKIYIETAVKERIVLPEETGRSFMPDAPITRLDMGYMIARALKIEPYKVWKPFRYPFVDNGDATINKLFFEYIIKGNIEKDGLRYFRPKSSTTRAETAVIIDRIKQYTEDKAAYKKRQKEELVASLIKAPKDEEFENFINSEEARKYASVDFFRAENGIIIFNEYNGWDFGDQIPQSTTYKHINRVIYNTVKELVKYARQNNHYVSCWLSAGGSEPVVIINYFEWSLNGDIQTINSSFRVSLKLVPYDVPDGGQKQISHWWNFGMLWDSDDGKVTCVEDLKKINFTQEAFIKPLEAAFKAIYGDKTGKKIYDYTLIEYRLECNTGRERENSSTKYFDGIELVNYNNKYDCRIDFSTNLGE